MFNKHRNAQFKAYNEAKTLLCAKPEILIGLEKFFAQHLLDLVRTNWVSIKADYDEASYLYPFWQNYPPDERGRQPKGDQYPWIEVGEHAVGERLSRILAAEFAIRDVGIPTGPDQRFLVTSPVIRKMTEGLTDSVWLFVEVKSAGPRDDAEHVVMSHNQVSGDGVWNRAADGLKNTVVKAVGIRSKHNFYCGLPPLYVLSDMTLAPVVNIVLKPVYSMASLTPGSSDGGQPLDRICIICIPNGILLLINPNYLKQYPGLLFPGKDDKGKNPLKVRARVSFEFLERIDDWRVCKVEDTA
ncbi:MAG: BglI family type II restriction endonuclease [Terriglobales bacterium]